MRHLEQFSHCFLEFSLQVSNAELISPIQLPKWISYKNSLTKIKQHVAFVLLSFSREKNKSHIQ